MRTLVALGVACVSLLATACSTTVNGVGLLPPNRGDSTSSSAATTGPDGTVVITYAEGHLRARFPAAPKETTEPGSFAGVSFTVHFAVANSGRKPTLAGSEDITEALPESSYAATLRGAVGGFGGSSGLALINQRADTFQGHVAQRATFADTIGTTYVLLAFVYSSTRLYLLFAPSGAPFDSLMESFVALP